MKDKELEKALEDLRGTRMDDAWYYFRKEEKDEKV